MVEETGCDGVVVGRGCLGRPWLFGDLVAAFQVRAGELSLEEAALREARPTLGVVAATLRRHTVLLAEFLSSEDDDGEEWACRDIRKHVSWYFKGYPLGSELRSALARVESLQQMDDLLGQLDWSEPYPGDDAEGPRGRAGHPKRTVLPEGWLDSRELAAAHRGELSEGEADTTGG
jgi:tRNA-dihydrouridine synthase